MKRLTELMHSVQGQFKTARPGPSLGIAHKHIQQANLGR